MTKWQIAGVVVAIVVLINVASYVYARRALAQAAGVPADDGGPT